MVTTAQALLLATVLVPAVAALAAAAVRSDGESAARLAVMAMVVTVVSGIGVVVLTAAAPVDVVVTDVDGRVVVGLYANRVGAALAVLSAGVGLVVVSFAGRALTADARAGRFFALTLALATSTTMVATSATVSGVVVGWVAAGIAISALIGHRSEWQPARRAVTRTRKALLVGDGALVLALVVLVATVGDLDLRDPTAAAVTAERIGPSGATVGLATIVGLLVVVAGISRSALVPLHRWLPSTVAAPTPVSALLHAGVVNGAGVLLIRLDDVFGASSAATGLAFGAGLATTVLATSVMLVRADVKGGLAWSTAGQMGFMVVQCAVGAFGSALFHIVGHGMYKAALFLGAGGAITAHARRALRPRPRPAMHRGLRVLLSLLVPAAVIGIVYPTVDPPLPTAGAMLVVLFAWATASRTMGGWLRAAPFAPSTAAVLGTAGVLGGVFSYLAALGAFERWVYDAVAHGLPGSVGASVLGAALAIVAMAGALLWWTPGPSGDRRRRVAYAFLLSTGIPPVPRARRGVGSGSPAQSVAAARPSTTTDGRVAP